MRAKKKLKDAMNVEWVFHGKYAHDKKVLCADCGTLPLCPAESAVPRYIFVQDDSSHWYQIPAGKQQDFENWVAAGPYWDSYYGPDFNDARLGMHISNYSFENVREEKC